MLMWLWILLSVGGFIGAAFSAAAEQPMLFIVLALLGWFFLTIAGGKDGLPLGIGSLVFVVCAFGVWYMPGIIGSSWLEAKNAFDALADKPEQVVLGYIGLIVLVVPLIIMPSLLAARLVGKLVSRQVAQPAPPASQPREREKKVYAKKVPRVRRRR